MSDYIEKLTKLSLATLGSYLKAVFKYPYLTLAIIFFVFIDYTLNVLAPILYKIFFDIMASGSPKEQAVGRLVSILFVIATIYATRWVFLRAAAFTSNYVRTKVMHDIANQTFAYLHKHSFSYFNNEFIGSLVKRVQWYVRAFEIIFDRIIWNLLPLFVNISIILIVLFFVNTLLALGVFIWLVGFIFFNLIIIKFKIKYDIKRSEAETKTTAVLADTITNHSNVKLFNGYGRELKKFFNVTENLRQLRRLTSDISSLVDAVQSILMFSLEIALFYFSIKFWAQGLLTIGDLVLLQAYVVTIFYRIWDFGRVLRDIYEALADAVEMTEILQTPHEVQDVPQAKKLKVTTGEITFENIDFVYPKGSSVMKDFNLSIPAHQRLALIGPSGAGKSTVVKLLLRMYDVSKGVIKIDGQDISKVTQESLWENISLVPQDPILFHQSLTENIRYGKPDASDEEVIKASKAAHAHEFITQLVNGYDTYVGERGIKLSGGERQRVAIARAILRNSPILILDEATSSLDSESEKFIQEALSEMIKNKTVIVIAHRLSTIKKMDRIVVIDDGSVIEEGTHHELKKINTGIYRKLWELQAGGFNEGG